MIEGKTKFLRSGRFKPTNTLTRDLQSPHTSSPPIRHAFSRGTGAKRSLDTTTVIGDHITTDDTAWDLHGPGYSRRTKRPRSDMINDLARPRQLLGKTRRVTLDSGLSPLVDRSKPDNVSVASSQKSTDQSNRRGSRPSTTLLEYSRVEDRMRLGNSRSKRKPPLPPASEPARQDLTSYDAPVPTLSHSSPARPIMLVDSQEDLPDSPNEPDLAVVVTADSDHDLSRDQPPVQSAETSTTSPYFDTSRQVNPSSIQGSSPSMGLSGARRQGMNETASEIDSPDPLQKESLGQPMTGRASQQSGSGRDRDQPNRRRSASPSADTSIRGPSADIKPTIFTRSARNGISRPWASAQRRTNRAHPSIFPLTRAGCGPMDIKMQEGLELCFDASSTAFTVRRADTSPPENELPLHFRIRDVNRVFFDKIGRKIQVNRRAGCGSDPKVDLELESRSGALDLRLLMEDLDPSIRVLERDSSVMDRIFDKRESERGSYERHRDHPKEVDPSGDKEAILHDLGNSPVKEIRDESQAGRTTEHADRSGSRSAEDAAGAAAAKEKGKDGFFKEMDDFISTRRAATTRSKSRAEIPIESVGDVDAEAERYSRKYGLGEPWKSPLVYPWGGQRQMQTSVDQVDLERLDEGEFLNDSLISFYLRYLEVNTERARPDFAGRIYIFNTFFYERLTSVGRGRRGISYDAVEKWTSKVDIFKYDYVVVPINESAHWYVAVICNLPRLIGDTGLEDDLKALKADGKDLASTRQSPNKTDASVTAVATSTLDPDSDLGSTEEKVSSMSLTQKEEEKQNVTQGAGGPPADLKRSGDGASLPVDVDVRDTFITGRAPLTSSPLSSQASKPRTRAKRKSLPPQKKYDPKEPVIITLDSLGQGHPATARNLKDYLKEEAQRKRKVSIDIGDLSGVTAKQIPLQDNYCDCGVYLLEYMKKFMENPKDLVTKILQRQLDADDDWPEMDPSKMRTRLRQLLLDLYQEQAMRKSGERARAEAQKTEGNQPKRHQDAQAPEQDGVERAANEQDKDAPEMISVAGQSTIPTVDAEGGKMETSPEAREPTVAGAGNPSSSG